MYLPAQFCEDRPDVIHALIHSHPLATVVAMTDAGLIANHVPLELDASAGPHGTLRGHVARANPVWKTLRAGVEAIAIFQGAQHYITPSYYATKAATGKVVPTWNYAAVHAYGPLRAIEDPVWLRGLVERLTDRHEADRAAATGAGVWHVGDAPEAFLETMIKAIVGIEIPISRVEAKWKVSQNRPVEDRAGVVAGLAGEPGEQAAAMAELVRERR
jgi:transcriptional regulator